MYVLMYVYVLHSCVKILRMWACVGDEFVVEGISECVMTQSHVWHGSFACVKVLIDVFGMTH